MEAILQENPDTLIFAGNVGNSGNSESISSSGATSRDIDLFQNGVLESGNSWEQAEAKVTNSLTNVAK